MIMDMLSNPRPCTRAVTKPRSELRECYAQLEIMACDEYEMKYGVVHREEDILDVAATDNNEDGRYKRKIHDELLNEAYDYDYDLLPMSSL